MPNYDPIVIKWNIDINTGEKISLPIIREQHKIVNSQFILIGIPDEIYKVEFPDLTMYEISNKQPITANSLYKVDYKIGIVYVHSDLEGQTIDVNYYSRGEIYYPSNRIYTELDGNGNIIETINDKINATEIVRQNAITASDSANESAINANNAAASSYFIFQTPVANFASISTTYPSPSENWAVQTLNDGKVYRREGSSWIYRLQGNIIPTINYVWIEEKTINAGNNNFTLTNSVGVNHKLIITDKTYNCEWIEGKEWNRSGQIITLTETSLLETLTFRIINLG